MTTRADNGHGAAEELPRHARQPDATAFSCLAAGTLGVLVLLGWALNEPALTSIGPSWLSTKPNTALGLLVLSASLWVCTNDRLGSASVIVGRAGALAVALLGAATLVEHAFGVDLGIDEVLIRDITLPKNAAPGRMSVVTASCFVVLGVATASLDRGAAAARDLPRWRARAHRFATVHAPLLVGFAAVQAVLAHSFTSPDLAPAPAVAWPTSAGLAILSTGLFLLRPDATALIASRWAPPVLLLACLTLTLMARFYALQSVRQTDARRFEDAVADARQLIQHRMEIYLGVLLGTGGMLPRAESLDRAALAAHVDALRALQGFRGFQGLGYVAVVPREVLAAHEVSMRTLGLSGYRVWPDGDRPYHAPIAAIEPFDARNQRAVGFDMASEPIRRAALERARDTGRPTISGKVSLVQDEPGRPGFLVIVPVYAELAPDSVEDRRRSLVGFVYSPFNAHLLFKGIFAENAHQKVDFEIFDCEPLAPDCLLHDDDGELTALSPPARNTLARLDRLEIAGKTWLLHFSPRPEFQADSPRRLPAYITASGLLLTALLFGLSYAQVRARVAAEQSVAARDAFLSIAAHELKTPLTPLLLQSQRILEITRDADVPEAVRSKARTIERAVRRLGRLVDELLDISQVGLGHLELKPERVNLSELVSEVAARMGEEAARAGSTIQVSARPGVVGTWDRVRLDQVITNLLANAIKYGRGRPIYVEVEARGERAVLWVRDQGIGIAPEDQARIFEKFGRAVSENHFSGFGIGLWVVREVVEASGGVVHLESRPEAGSTFTIWLPRRREGRWPR